VSEASSPPVSIIGREELRYLRVLAENGPQMASSQRGTFIFRRLMKKKLAEQKSFLDLNRRCGDPNANIVGYTITARGRVLLKSFKEASDS
jgi:hypothetical protein